MANKPARGHQMSPTEPQGSAPVVVQAPCKETNTHCSSGSRFLKSGTGSVHSRLPSAHPEATRKQQLRAAPPAYVVNEHKFIIVLPAWFEQAVRSNAMPPKPCTRSHRGPKQRPKLSYTSFKLWLLSSWFPATSPPVGKHNPSICAVHDDHSHSRHAGRHQGTCAHAAPQAAMVTRGF